MISGQEFLFLLNKFVPQLHNEDKKLWEPRLCQLRNHCFIIYQNVEFSFCSYLLSYTILFKYSFKSNPLITKWVTLVCVFWLILCSAPKRQWVTGSPTELNNILLLKLRSLSAEQVSCQPTECFAENLSYTSLKNCKHKAKRMNKSYLKPTRLTLYNHALEIHAAPKTGIRESYRWG